ncbi:putative glycosidase CRH2 [Coemansia sp. RSA 1824]|nr:putative glycosidase CRH2 [Coemansia sp. RSA 1824]
MGASAHTTVSNDFGTMDGLSSPRTAGDSAIMSLGQNVASSSSIMSFSAGSRPDAVPQEVDDSDTSLCIVRNLIGSSVTAGSKLVSMDGSLGIFFVFPDLSIRKDGDYRLRFSFFNLQSDNGELMSTVTQIKAHTFSEPFRVYSAKQFPGMIESTMMSKHFAKQGVKIPVRKESAKCGTQECGKDTPCCVKGFCNRNAMYCAPFNCEPENSRTPDSCWNTAHCVDETSDFNSATAFAQVADYKGDPHTTQYVSKFEPSNAKHANEQLELELVKQPDGKGFGAVVTGTRAIQYGTVTAVMRSGSTAGGVVSSFIIRNDKVGDEIDFEFVGNDKTAVQSNYYWHNDLDYTKMVRSPQLTDTTHEYHAYQIQWTPEQIVWAVDGKTFRTVRRADTWDPKDKVFKFPDAEAYVSFSIWDGGAGAKGTADWAGGKVNWAAAPFKFAIKNVSTNCYFKGNETTYVPPADAKK